MLRICRMVGLIYFREVRVRARQHIYNENVVHETANHLNILGFFAKILRHFSYFCQFFSFLKLKLCSFLWVWIGIFCLLKMELLVNEYLLLFEQSFLLLRRKTHMYVSTCAQAHTQQKWTHLGSHRMRRISTFFMCFILFFGPTMKIKLPQLHLCLWGCFFAAINERDHEIRIDGSKQKKRCQTWSSLVEREADTGLSQALSLRINNSLSSSPIPPLQYSQPSIFVPWTALS